MIETKKNEVSYTTSDPSKMLNKYLVKGLKRGWKEDFHDEDTGEIVSIERHEIIFDKGSLIDSEKLSTIQFHMLAGEITEVEVSNQKRIAYQLESNFLHPFMAQAEIRDRKVKFLFYASKIDTALLILKDYIELNYRDPFSLSLIKEFDSCIILTDRLSMLNGSGDVPNTLFNDDLDYDTEDSENIQKKFYQIEVNIEYDDEYKISQTFVVHTFNVDRGMMLINDYLTKQEEKKEIEARKHNRDYERSDFRTMIELAKPIPVGVFIPYQFSKVYADGE